MIPPKYAQFTPPEADFFDFMFYFWCVFLTKSAKSDFLKKSSFKPKSSLVYRLTDWMAARGVDTEPNVYFARPYVEPCSFCSSDASDAEHGMPVPMAQPPAVPAGPPTLNLKIIEIIQI